MSEWKTYQTIYCFFPLHKKCYLDIEFSSICKVKHLCRLLYFFTQKKILFSNGKGIKKAYKGELQAFYLNLNHQALYILLKPNVPVVLEQILFYYQQILLLYVFFSCPRNSQFHPYLCNRH